MVVLMVVLKVWGPLGVVAGGVAAGVRGAAFTGAVAGAMHLTPSSRQSHFQLTAMQLEKRLRRLVLRVRG